MSGKLVGEVVDWLMTPAAVDLTVAERTILMVIAERCHESTRLMLRHRVDDQPLVDRLSTACGLEKEGGLKRAFQRLARRGLEVRIPIKTGRDGRTVFAHDGVSMAFRLPEFPASIAIPERGDDGTSSAPVDNPATTPQETSERGDGASRLSAERGDGASPEGGRESPPNPSSPSTTYPSKDPSHLSPVADLEDTPVPSVAFEEQKFDQREYEAALKRLMEREDFGGPLVARAESDEPTAPHEIHVIHAARLAKGIPA